MTKYPATETQNENCSHPEEKLNCHSHQQTEISQVEGLSVPNQHNIELQSYNRSEADSTREQRSFSLATEHFSLLGQSVLLFFKIVPLKDKAPLQTLTDNQSLEPYLESRSDLICPIPSAKSKSKTPRLLTPLGISSILIFLGANILLGLASIPKEKFFKTQTTAIQLETSSEPTVANVPNLAVKEFVNLDLDTIATLQANSNKSSAANQPNSAAVVTNSPQVIPGAYSDLASALLPPSMRPHLTKSYIVQPAREGVNIPPFSTDR